MEKNEFTKLQNYCDYNNSQIILENGNNGQLSSFFPNKQLREFDLSPKTKEKNLTKVKRLKNNLNTKNIIKANDINEELNERINKLIINFKNQLDKNYIEKRIINLKCSKNGDYSYINSLVICLSNLPDLLIYLKQNIQLLNNPQKFPLTFCFFRVVEHLYLNIPKNKSNIYDSLTIIKVIEHCFPFLKESKNPIDLFSLLISNIHKELNENKTIVIPKNTEKMDLNEVIKHKIIYFNNTNESIISKIFNSFYKKEIKCSICNNTFYELENFFSFDLDPINTFIKYNKNILTIYDCLTYYIQPKTSKLICSVCNRPSNLVTLKNIFSPSKNLVFVINRYNYNEDNLITKIKLNYEEILDISQFIDKKLVDIKTEYILIAVVSYSFNKKNFLAFCKNLFIDEWVYFNDNSIDQCNFNYILNNTIPCLLFYRMLD